MAARGRKSAASLSVISGSIDMRPDAPDDLTEDEECIWRDTVAHEAADVFGTSALQQLLRDYCRHVVAAKRLSDMIEAAMSSGDAQVELKDLDTLLRMRDRETKAVADKATKLRLTNQSRYTPKAAATAAKNAGQAKKPWQM